MKEREPTQDYTEQETIARREAALKRMLSTPHQPHRPIGKKKASPNRLQKNQMTDKIAELERRLALIEAFLDTELRERQHLTQLNSPNSGGPINPWYGCSLGINIEPINASPIVTKHALRRA